MSFCLSDVAETYVISNAQRTQNYLKREEMYLDNTSLAMNLPLWIHLLDTWNNFQSEAKIHVGSRHFVNLWYCIVVTLPWCNAYDRLFRTSTVEVAQVRVPFMTDILTVCLKVLSRSLLSNAGKVAIIYVLDASFSPTALATPVDLDHSRITI